MANRFCIKVANDAMNAAVSVAAGEPCTVDDLRKAISDAGVCKGILDEPVEKIGKQAASKDFTIEKQVIAEGKPAREGKAGKLHIDNPDPSRDVPVWHLTEGSGKGGKETGAKSFQISLIKGQEIGSIDRCDPGEAGYTVKDGLLEQKKVENPLDRLGNGLECNTQDQVCATATGVMFDREGERLCVVPLPTNKRILLAISDDKMQATARLFPGEPGDAATVDESLKAFAVTHGVDAKVSDQLAKKLRDPIARLEDMPLAEGTPAEAGKDGYFEPDFSVGTMAGKLRSDGSIDFRDRSTLVAASEGETLGINHDPTKGTAGYDIHGTELPPTPGKEVPPKLGEGAEMGENNTVVATLDGVINYQPGGTLVVNAAYEHRGDVDLKSGDLKMNGAIVVTGDVTRNAKVEATEGVVIKGMIDAGGIECDGPVTVEGGVVVEDKAWIRAGGNVTCRHTQGARIESKETITIQQNAVNSFLTAKVITGESESARVLGGVLAAEELIVVGEAGSELGARTVLSVAVPLNWEYPPVADRLGKPAKAGSREKGKPKKGKRKKGESPKEQIKRLLESARIEVRGKLHSGVVIEMGELSMTIEREVQRVRFRYSTAKDEPKILMEGISIGESEDKA